MGVAEKKSLGYGGFSEGKLNGAGAFSEEDDAAADFSRRHSHDLITLLASSDTSCSNRMTNGFGLIGQDTNASRIPINDLHTNEPECEDQSEGFSGARIDGTQKRKELKRTWREEWKTKHKWVYPIKNTDGELRLKCTWCTFYNMDNVFSKEGCSTIQMSALNTHAKSEAHKTAESRISAPDNPDNLPDGLFDGSRESMEGDVPGKKRTFPTTTTNQMPTAGMSEALGSIMQKNNSRIVQLLLDAESGRNSRHATNLALAKKRIRLEEQRLQVEQHLLEQDKARFNAHVSLSQTFIAALTDIGEGLKRIGNAMEVRKTI